MTEISLFVWENANLTKNLADILTPLFCYRNGVSGLSLCKKYWKKTSLIYLNIFTNACETAKIRAGKHGQITMLQIDRKGKTSI